VTAKRDERPLKVRLKTKKSRTVSQKRWLERQLNDPYVARARREGMRSRAAYKLIEIDDRYHVLKAGAHVVDLGAAPGGWSFSAAKRGARVIAVDNGPLKGGALDNPLIEHRLEDAFKFVPPSFAKATEGTAAQVEPYDWLFCDLVEEPHHVMRNLVTPWLSGGWCRRFVINLKFGHVDALALLREVRAAESPFTKYATNVHIRHLYHDREEFTVVGETRA
jgi:23S rRNA (cytidine2498-2'-O)-methyltransferase